MHHLEARSAATAKLPDREFLDDGVRQVVRWGGALNDLGRVEVIEHWPERSYA